MKSSKEIISIASQTLMLEAEAITKLSQRLNDSFASIVQHLLNSKGRVIVTGIGKSAIIANKIVATLNSTGTPSMFMHAADAVHGDLGMIQKNDSVICISKSGNTPEIKVLVPLLKQSGNILIALVGNTSSYLAEHSDFILDSTVEKEACPNNLAPTTSTTAQLALGDALAVSLLHCRDFTSEDFARFHPGGALGKRLYLKVSDISQNNELPQVTTNENIRGVLLEITTKRLGAVAVIEGGNLVGMITDGDIRRMMEREDDIGLLSAKDIMNPDPITIENGELAINALEKIRENNISQILVTQNGKYAGVVHLHDLLREGII
ncbi:MAG: arabinose-5-phosphate isomerase [Sphingobacteriales bacterium]